MVEKRTFLGLFLAGLLVSLLCVTLLYARDRKIDYIPRDQQLVTVDKDYSFASYYLDESDNLDLEEINRKLSRCLECIDIKATCPDCCVAISPNRETKIEDFIAAVPVMPFQPSGEWDERSRCFEVSRCQEQEIANYHNVSSTDNLTDTQYRVFKEYCSGSSIGPCQSKGCPSDEPDSGGWSGKCARSDDGKGWICDRNDIRDLKYKGCRPANKSGVEDCYKEYSGKFYTDVSLDLGEEFCISKIGEKQCYKYTPNQKFLDCADDCRNKSAIYESAYKDYNCHIFDSDICCQGSSCMYGVNHENGDTIRPGYNNNCNNSSCISRVDWPECQPTATPKQKELCCDTMTGETCADFLKEKDLILDEMIRGVRSSAFEDISKPGEEFVYEFVAKSNERLMIIYLVQASPEFCEAKAPGSGECKGAWGTDKPPATSFYTMVKMYDMSDNGKEVYPGSREVIINQKSFQGAFSIYSAIATPVDGDGKSILQQGHNYKVKINYLLAPLPDYVLRAKISHLQFIILRTRE
ncbi:MAG: hypothetical protein MUF05_01200 [Candidatus Omnitrophica bacterium]|jgi:hypothetical protein|nr:hypothetical protein [Candidatus Omnitrophota bacterium]